jgi:hypothetical protein
MIDRAEGPDGDRIAVLPPGAGQRQIVIDRPVWLGVAETLVRQL